MSFRRLLLISLIPLVFGCGRDTECRKDDPVVAVFYRDDYPDPQMGGVKDYTLVLRNGTYHIFHIGDPRRGWMHGGETDFVHATSDDLVHWTRQPRLDLRHPDWSRSNLWSPSIYAENGVYYMFYTGVEWGPEVDSIHSEPAYNWQRIGLAVSWDLRTWTPAVGDGMVLDGPSHDLYPWSAYGSHGTWRNDCRDPFVLHTDGGYVLFAAVRLYDGETLGPMAIAVAHSENLLEWTWGGYLPVTQGAKAESPNVIRRGRYYYLFWTGAGSAIEVARSTHADTDYNRIPSQGVNYGYAGEILIEPDRNVWGAIGRGDEFLEAYVLQLKKVVFADHAPVPVLAQEFRRSELGLGSVPSRCLPVRDRDFAPAAGRISAP
jgi:hypothetical protein